MLKELDLCGCRCEDESVVAFVTHAKPGERSEKKQWERQEEQEILIGCIAPTWIPITLNTRCSPIDVPLSRSLGDTKFDMVLCSH